MSSVVRKLWHTVAALAIAAAAVVAPTTASAITQGEDARIGTVADSTARVQVGNKSCTGTLIASEWILTAAHCKGVGDYSFVSVGAPANGEKARVAKVIVHPASDLMLVKTNKRMQSPVAPLATSYTGEETAGYSMGWGSVMENGKDIIQQADVEVQRRVTNVAGAINPADVFYEGYVYNGHLGQGDSGGPLFIDGQLAGVASLANSAAKGSRLDGALGWWVPVQDHYDWIAENTGIATPAVSGVQGVADDTMIFHTTAPPVEIPRSVQVLQDLQTINENTQLLYEATQSDGGALASLSSQLSS